MTPPGMLVGGRRVGAGPSPGRGPNGRRLCRWCHQEVPKGRVTWCGDECVKAYTSIARPRPAVFARDRGVCALCGVDTVLLERVLRHAARSISGGYGGPTWDRLLRERGFGGVCRSLWDADHVVPVVEGGTVALDNLRTLCVPCHKRETAALHRRLADSRRAR